MSVRRRARSSAAKSSSRSSGRTRRNRAARDLRPALVVVIACAAVLLAGFELKSCPLSSGSRLRGLCYSDIKYFVAFRGIAHSPFPYVHGGFKNGTLLNGSIEYPVLTGLFMWGTAQTGGSSAPRYLSINAAALRAVALMVAYALARLKGWRALMWALAPAVALYAFHNWDLLAVGAMLAGIWAWSRGRLTWAVVRAFTSASCSEIFGGVFGHNAVRVRAYGNVLSAIAFLAGLASEELRTHELDMHDRCFSMLVSVCATK